MSDPPNDIAVAGTFIFDSTVEDVGNAVTVGDVEFIDASKVLTGKCSALHQAGDTSALLTTPSGPYRVGDADLGPRVAGLGSRKAACGPALAAH